MSVDASAGDQDAVQVPAVRVGLSTASVYPQGCADAFSLAAELGYDGVEVMVWSDPVSQSGTALKRLSEYHKVPILAIHAPTLLVSQRIWGKDPWPKVTKSCDLANEVGADVVVLHPPFRWQKEYAARFVEGVMLTSVRTGVRLAVENMYPWRAGQREMLAYAPDWDPVEQAYADVTLDLSHAATAGQDSLDLARRLGSRLAHVHLADGSGSAKDEHLLPGHGSQPCGAVLGFLAERNWDGAVVLEVNTRRARGIAERERDLAESLAFARLHLASRVTA